MSSAPPIFRNDKTFASHGESCIKTTACFDIYYGQIPRTRTVAEKDVKNPKSEYHEWLAEKKSDQPFESIRNQWVAETIASNEHVMPFIRSSPYIPYDKLSPTALSAMNMIIGYRTSLVKHILAKPEPVVNNSYTELMSLKKIDEKITNMLGILGLAPKTDYVKSMKHYNLTDVMKEIKDECSVFKSIDFLGSIYHPNIVEEEKPVPLVIVENPEDMGKQYSHVIELSDDLIFRHLVSLGWKDKDEQIMTKADIKKLEVRIFINIFVSMRRMAEKLLEAIYQKTDVLNKLTPLDRFNFAFHVLAKGKEMYVKSLAEPEVCLYMMDQFQPLFEWMKEVTKSPPAPAANH